MRFVSEMWSDGPYVRVLLPDVLPPDWRRYDASWNRRSPRVRRAFS